MFENIEWQLKATDDASKQFEKVKKAQDDLVSSSEKSAVAGEKTSSSWKSIAGGVAVGTAAIGAAKTAFNFLKGAINESIQEASQFQSNQAALNAAIISTKGSAGLTVQELNNMASELQNLTAVDDDVINSMQAMQLTFTNIKAPIFKEVSIAALDMATAMNNGVLPSAEQLKTASIQLGKAMQDPVTGATALQRIGIKLTEQQKEQIATMIKSGDVMGAQKVILGELSTEFGGRAAAAANTYQGQISRLHNAMGDVKKQIGQALMPTLTMLTGGIADSTGKVMMSEDTMHRWQIKIYQVATIMVGAIKTVINFAKVIWDLVNIVAKGAAVQVAAWGDIGRAIIDFGKHARVVFDSLRKAMTGDFAGAFAALKNDFVSTFQTTGFVLQDFLSTAKKTGSDFMTAFDPMQEAVKKATDLKAFNEQISKMKEAESASKQYAGGMTGALADAADSAGEKSKDIKSAWEKVVSTYKEGGPKIQEALAKLEEDHDSSVKSMQEKMSDLKRSFLDTVAAYKSSIAEMNQSEAEKFVDQEKKIIDLKKQIANEQTAAAGSEDQSKNAARIAELQAQLKLEEDALASYGARAKELTGEITEARRRASQSEFTNFVEDMAKKRAQLDVEHLKKLSDIQSEVTQLQQAAAEESIIYEAKKQQYNEVALQFVQFHDTYITNLNDMKANTDKSVEAMNKKLQEMLAILAQIESAKNKAGILGGGLGAPAPTPSNAPAGSNSGGGGITVNFGDVHVNSQSDIDALMAALTRQLQLSGQGSH